MFAGEDQAARLLLERYRRPLYGMLWRLTRSAADSEDLFQETFVRALKARSHFDPSRRFRPWLFAIALNLARDRAKRLGHGATPRLTSDGESPEPAHGGARKDESETRALESFDLERALSSLSDHHREVVLLRYYLGMDEAEIARAAGIPRGTVKSRLHHALGAMRRYLKR